MVRLCTPTKVSTASLTTLIVAYFVVTGGVQLLRFSPALSAVLFQGANVGTLGALIAIVASMNQRRGCGGRWTWSWVTLGVLGLNLLARLISIAVLAVRDRNDANGEARFVRWDETAKTVGLVAVLAEIYYALVPNMRFRSTLFIFGLLFVVPLALAIPRLLTAPSVDKDTLQAALRFSAKAYEAYDGGNDQTKRVVSGEHAGWTYVGFAGTETAKDAKTDVTISDSALPEGWLRPGDRARAHTGFADMYAKLRDKVRVLVKDAKQVTFVGHSLGGALASLAALDVASGFPDKTVRVVTFGAPQVGDHNFVKLFDARVDLCVRVVNPFDPVPKLLASQLRHTKGYYAVASLSLDSPVTAHNMKTYEVALGRPRWAQMLGVFAPATYVGVAALAVGAYHIFIRRSA